MVLCSGIDVGWGVALGRPHWGALMGIVAAARTALPVCCSALVEAGVDFRATLSGGSPGVHIVAVTPVLLWSGCTGDHVVPTTPVLPCRGCSAEHVVGTAPLPASR